MNRFILSAICLVAMHCVSQVKADDSRLERAVAIVKKFDSSKKDERKEAFDAIKAFDANDLPLILQQIDKKDYDWLFKIVLRSRAFSEPYNDALRMARDNDLKLSDGVLQSLISSACEKDTAKHERARLAIGLISVWTKGKILSDIKTLGEKADAKALPMILDIVAEQHLARAMDDIYSAGTGVQPHLGEVKILDAKYYAADQKVLIEIGSPSITAVKRKQETVSEIRQRWKQNHDIYVESGQGKLIGASTAAGSIPATYDVFLKSTLKAINDKK